MKVKTNKASEYQIVFSAEMKNGEKDTDFHLVSRSTIHDGWKKGYHGYDFKFDQEITRDQFKLWCHLKLSMDDVDNPNWKSDHALIYPAGSEELSYSNEATSDTWTWRWVRTD